MSNELYAIHWKDKLLHPDLWKKYSGRYGQSSSYLYGWRPPKKVYHKLGHAKAGLSHLPAQIRKDCKIVRYVPEEVIQENPS